MTTQRSPLLWLQSYFFYSIFVLPLPIFVMEKPKPKGNRAKPEKSNEKCQPVGGIQRAQIWSSWGWPKGRGVDDIVAVLAFVGIDAPLSKRRTENQQFFYRILTVFFFNWVCNNEVAHPITIYWHILWGRFLSNIFTLLGFLADNRLFLLKKAFRVVILGIFL